MMDVCVCVCLFVCLQESKIFKFLGFMWNPLSWVMEAAAVMAIALANGGVSTELSHPVDMAEAFWRLGSEVLMCVSTVFFSEQAARLAGFRGDHHSAHHQLHNQLH